MTVKEYYVIPTIGQFKVTVTTNYDFYNKTQIYDYILNVGGRYDKCINITIHPENSPKNKELILSWAEVLNRDCTTDGQIIKGEATVKMVELAFTIAKEIAPYAEYVTLNDMSYFYCDTPDGKKKVSLPPYYIAFNDKTWYEDKFKATLSNTIDYKKYKECINTMYKEGIKPSYFDFGNDNIKDILLPLYIETKTWKQFFNLINEKFPRDKCTLMYPWIESAISTIFKSCGGGDLYIGKEWTIVLNSIPKVHYYQIGKTHIQAGGVSIKYMNQYDNYRTIEYNQVNNWDIYSYLKKKRARYTKKNYTKKNRNTIKNIDTFSQNV